MRQNVLRDPRSLFTAQRCSAERRNIPWRFTYGEWWELWAPHWDRRVPDNLQLCRNGDCGGYEVGNCHIASAEVNLQEYRENVRAKTAKAIAEGYSLAELVESVERAALTEALDVCGGNVTQAAAYLGITFRQIRYKLREYEIGRPARGRAAARMVRQMWMERAQADAL